MRTACESFIKRINTSIVGACDGSEPLLSGRIPDLQFTHFVVNFQHPEPEINANGSKVVIDEVIITEPEKEWGFANTLISDKHNFEYIILFFDHIVDSQQIVISNFIY